MLLYKKTTAIFLLYLFSISLSACHPTADTFDSDNHAIHLEDYQGKWVLINYWATWCQSCLIEMPILNNLIRDYPNQVQIIGVNREFLTPSQLKQVSKQFKINYPLTNSFPSDKLGIADDQITVVPFTLVINPQGKLFRILMGEQTQQQLIQILNLKKNKD